MTKYVLLFSLIVAGTGVLVAGRGGNGGGGSSGGCFHTCKMEWAACLTACGTDTGCAGHSCYWDTYIPCLSLCK